MSFKDYLRNPRQVLDERRTCPSCGRPLGHHARYRRAPIVDGQPVETWLYRLRCRPCKQTFTLLPTFLGPRRRYLAEVVGVVYESFLSSGASVRQIAVEMSGLAVPPGGNVRITDALLGSLRPRPSYQRVFAWLKEFCASAKSISQGLMAWSLRLQPDHGVLHQLAADTDWIRGKARTDQKGEQLQAAAMLRKLVLDIPALEAARLGWPEALSRFIERILGGSSSRAPPATHGET